MDARFYNSDAIDIERLANDLVNIYLSQGYQAQHIGNKDQMMVQLKKGGDFEAIIGMQAALSLTLQKTRGGVLAMIGQQRWVDKAAVGAVGVVMPLLWPLAVTAGVGALRQASLGNQVLNMVDGLVRQQVPEVQAGPVPYNIVQQVQQGYAPTPGYTPPPQPAPAYVPPQPLPQPPQPVYRPQTAPAPAAPQLRCSHCNTPYEPGDTFCTGCGRSLTPPRLYCSKCNSEVKPGVAFCPKCGSSTFQTAAGGPQAAPPPAPSVTYTPPAQQKPSMPTYTPPQKPATPVYTPPPTPSVTVASSSQPVTPPKPEEPAYVPPTPQTPVVVPQPKVTIVQGQKKETPTPSAPPPRPQKVYYTPSSQAQQAPQAEKAADQPVQDLQDNAVAPTLPAQPAAKETPYYTPSWNSQPTVADQSQQAAQPAADAGAPWGTLILASGDRVQLKGERVIVGRADHDLSSDLQPEVDLSNQQGADTVSRLHAVLEHVGNTYTLTDLDSTNSTRINNKLLDPDKATPINDGDTLQFGKVTATFKKL
jgi:hypothetical protein